MVAWWRLMMVDSVGYSILQREVTLRDQFAMAALTVMEREISRSGDDDAYIAEQAYNLADAMLAERERAK